MRLRRERPTMADDFAADLGLLELPPRPSFDPAIRRAPRRNADLSASQEALALANALRYIKPEWQEEIAPEFLSELRTRGRIYGYRFRPAGAIRGKPIGEYKGACVEGRALQVMIDNNLDFAVALYPYELVTYGETGQVCQNWMQYLLIKKFLEEVDEGSTLVVESGHPLGLFKSHPYAPRAIVTNGLMVGMFDNQKDFNVAAALGVANYGQMTAGGWMYIGPQGIVHGTFNTLLNAGRLKLGVAPDGDLAGKLFVSSGLGGMSGAQGRAATIAGAAAIVAEVDPSRVATRLSQGWADAVADSCEEAFRLARAAADSGNALAVAFRGNVVDLLEWADSHNAAIDLLSDQTSCHAAYEGGYCPAGVAFAERTRLLAGGPADRASFAKLVDGSLKRHFEAIERLSAKGA